MAVDPFAGANQGLKGLQDTLMNIYQMKRQEKQDAEQSGLRALQMQGAQQGVEQGALNLSRLRGEQNALIDQYGTQGQADPYGRALSFQNQEKMDAGQADEKRKQGEGRQKMFMEGFAKVADAVEKGLIDEDEAAQLFKSSLKIGGMNLDEGGISVNFKRGKGGLVKTERMFKDGELTDPTTGQPLPAGWYAAEQQPTGDPANPFRLVNYKAVEQKSDQEALIDKRFANQQTLQSQQIAAQDRRTAKQIEAADRRAATTGGGHGGGAVPGGKILPAGQLESIADMKRVKDVMAEARDLLKSTKVDTGPVVGRLQSLGSKVGLASDDFVNVQQKMQTAENIMLKLRSGAAVTESEYQRFKKEFPRTSDSPEVRDRKMNNAINYATELMDSKMSIYEEGGYRVPQSVKSGGKAAAPSPKNKPAAPRKIGKYTVEVH